MQINSALTSAIAEASTCMGVPPFRGQRRVECGEPLPVGRFRLCSRCDAEIERRQEAAADEIVTDGRRRALEASGISVPFTTGAKSLDTVRIISDEHQAAMVAVRRFINWTPDDGNTRGVLLRGDAGIGKTDLAEGATRELVLKGKPAKYVNARTLATALQTAFRDNATESVDEILDRYTARDRALWLALDDLGATRTTRFISDSFYSLLERRARNQMPTLIVTNYQSMADLAARLKPTDGDALDAIRPVDRIEELAPVVITLRGSSQRALVSREDA